MSNEQELKTKDKSHKTKVKTGIEEFDYLDFWTMEPRMFLSSPDSLIK